MEFTSKKIAQILNESQSKARRWVKDFLPPDPDIGLRSGKTRQHGLNDVFSVFLGGYLVTGMGFSVSDAKIILDDIRPRLAREGLLPLRTAEYAPRDRIGYKVERIDIHIVQTAAPSAFCYEIRWIVREHNGQGGIVKSKYLTDRFPGNGIAALDPVVDHVRILPITRVLSRFQALLSVCSR